MLIKISIENYKSFDSLEEVSLISSSKIRSNPDHKTTIKKVNILKNAVIYGANASGKSNLVKALSLIKTTLVEGLPINSINDYCRNRTENKDRKSQFELQFTVGNKFYAYGFSSILSQRRIVEEWLYELNQDGNAKNVFSRELDKVPELGDINIQGSEKRRFDVYASDFINQPSALFLSEMNRGKKYDDKSRLIVFSEVYNWLVNNIVVLFPNMGIANTDAYYKQESLEKISELISTFDTGVNQICTQKITVEELSKKVPVEILNSIIYSIKQQMQMANTTSVQMSWRLDAGFYNIRMYDNEEPEITSLVLKHGKSLLDFDFAEESDGTKRLFELVDLILSKREDTVYVVDELERSLHPKLTEHFLRLFMDSHKNERVQLIFTTHEDTIMDQELFRRDEIWFVERDSTNSSDIYSLDRFKERYDKKLSKAYLEGRYGAIPVFKQFSFEDKED